MTQVGQVEYISVLLEPSTSPPLLPQPETRMWLVRDPAPRAVSGLGRQPRVCVMAGPQVGRLMGWDRLPAHQGTELGTAREAKPRLLNPMEPQDSPHEVGEGPDLSINPPHDSGAPQHSLAPVSRLLELVPPVLCMLLFKSPHPSDDLLQCLVGLLGVIDDERRVFLLLRAVVH